MITYSTIDQVKAKAAETELSGINFLKEDGSFARGNFAAVHHVDLLFIDGVTLTIDAATMRSPAFDSLNFRLAPTKPNA